VSYVDERDPNGFERLVPFKPTHLESQAAGPSRIITESRESSAQKRERADEIGDYPQVRPIGGDINVLLTTYV